MIGCQTLKKLTLYVTMICDDLKQGNYTDNMIGCQTLEKLTLYVRPPGYKT